MYKKLKRVAYWYCILSLHDQVHIYLPEFQVDKKVETVELETEAARLFRDQDIESFLPMNLREMMSKTKRYIRSLGGNPDQDFLDYNIITTHVEVDSGSRITNL